MKKLLLLAFVLLTGVLILSSRHRLIGVSAQNTANESANSAPLSDRATDFQLAQTIRRLTNRSTDGLVQERKSGAFMIDLQDRFQNVMLSKLDADGEPEASCVTSLEEANEFFGRDLETGQPLFSAQTGRNDTATIAARHGMSQQEFEFYTKMIADAAARRAANPESATINIVNGDDPGEGFNDPTAATPEGGNNGVTRGEQRLNLFNYAASIWGAYLDTSVPINVNSQFNSLTPCSTSGGVLGSAGTTNIFRDFVGSQYSGTWYHVALANKRSGFDLNNDVAEINARFNSDVDNGCLGGSSRFYYGLNNSTPAQRINLLVVLLHEMGHGLGFSSFVSGSTGALNSGLPDVFTRYMYDRTTGKYWYQMTNAERQASAINTGNVLWDGPNVKAASGFLTNGRDSAGRVQLYTPGTFAQGSSISHFDTADTPNLLMEPNINVGLPIDLDLTRQQMRDIGWYRDTTADGIPDTIENVQPSGGSLLIGSSKTITWTNTGGFNRNVVVELSIDGGATFPYTLVTDAVNTGSLNFTVPNLPTTQGRIRVREYNFVDPIGISAVNFTISSTAVFNTRFDFDNDGKADISVYRPDTGTWYLQQSTAGFTGIAFGLPGDLIAPADFDGDGKTDLAVFRPSNGTWYLQRSQTGFLNLTFGTASDIPMPADFDGDGKADLAVFRPSTGTWYIYNLANNTTSSAVFGQNGDVPAAADYDGDGKADLAVFRPSNGTWYLQRSQQGFTAIQFGTASDSPAPADYDGDGKTDLAVFRPSNGTWYLQRSRLGFTTIQFGVPADLATPADYDGDGKADIAVFRPSTGTWYLQRSQTGFTGVAFGINNDKPVPNAFIP